MYRDELVIFTYIHLLYSFFCTLCSRFFLSFSFSFSLVNVEIKRQGRKSINFTPITNWKILPKWLWVNLVCNSHFYKCLNVCYWQNLSNSITCFVPWEIKHSVRRKLLKSHGSMKFSHMFQFDKSIMQGILLILLLTILTSPSALICTRIYLVLA